MALFGLGSWNEITPALFTQAMERGAQLGLSQRQQEREEATAADRLRLAYDQLHSMERRASESAQTRLKIGLAAQALRAQQIGDIANYRKAQIDHSNAMLDLAKSREQRLAGASKPDELEKFDLSQDKAKLKGLQKEIDDTEPVEPHKMLPFGLGPLMKGNIDELNKKKAAADALRQKIGSFGGKSKGRIRIKGPSGQTGTVAEGTDLPEGWEEADE